LYLLEKNKISETCDNSNLKFSLKTFDLLPKSFFMCFKLEIFEEKLSTFNTWLKNKISHVFKYFTQNFSNFDLALKNLYTVPGNRPFLQRITKNNVI